MLTAEATKIFMQQAVNYMHTVDVSTLPYLEVMVMLETRYETAVYVLSRVNTPKEINDLIEHMAYCCLIPITNSSQLKLDYYTIRRLIDVKS